MARKPVISSPIKTRTDYAETRALEFAVGLARDIKAGKIHAIQHNKAAVAMRAVYDAIGDAIDAANQHLQSGLSHDESQGHQIWETLRSVVDSDLAQGTELGDWFNQERNTKKMYHQIMDVLAFPEPVQHQESKLEQWMPRRLAKTYNKYTQQTQDYKKRLSQSSARSTDTVSSTDELDAPSTPGSKKNGF